MDLIGMYGVILFGEIHGEEDLDIVGDQLKIVH